MPKLVCIVVSNAPSAASPFQGVAQQDPHHLPVVRPATLLVPHSTEDRMLTLFLLNRSLDDPISISVDASGLGTLAPSAATTLRNDDLEAVNTKDATPVAPAPLDAIAVTDGGLRVTLPAASWNVVRLKASGS